MDDPITHQGSPAYLHSQSRTEVANVRVHLRPSGRDLSWIFCARECARRWDQGICPTVRFRQRSRCRLSRRRFAFARSLRKSAAPSSAATDAPTANNASAANPRSRGGSGAAGSATGTKQSSAADASSRDASDRKRSGTCQAWHARGGTRSAVEARADACGVWDGYGRGAAADTVTTWRWISRSELVVASSMWPRSSGTW